MVLHCATVHCFCWKGGVLIIKRRLYYQKSFFLHLHWIHFFACFNDVWRVESYSFYEMPDLATGTPQWGQIFNKFNFWSLKFRYSEKATNICPIFHLNSKLWIGNVKLRQEVVNIWIFVFPAKEDSTDWEASTEKLVQIALTFSWFFSAAPKLLVDFSQQVHDSRKNSNCLYTCRNLTLPIHGLFKSLRLYSQEPKTKQNAMITWGPVPTRQGNQLQSPPFLKNCQDDTF